MKEGEWFASDDPNRQKKTTTNDSSNTAVLKNQNEREQYIVERDKQYIVHRLTNYQLANNSSK